MGVLPILCRARSASKKGTWPPSLYPSEPACFAWSILIFLAVGQVFESAVAIGKGFDDGDGLDRIQVDTGRDSR